MASSLADRLAAVSAPGAAAVVALVLTGRDRAGLAALLDALDAQTAAPDSVIVLDRTVGGGDGPTVAEVLDAHPLDDRVEAEVRRVDPAVPVRAAALEAVDGLHGDSAVWLLPCGCAPEPHALAVLREALRRSPSHGVVGPKLVDAAHPDALRSAGIVTTRSGRVLEDPADGTLDQGQLDDRRDVVAVPFAGALADADLVRDLRGWERSFGDVGSDLDLGWRAQLRGRRVVLAPAARVRAVRGVGLATATTADRRREARRVALARCSWWAMPVLMSWVLITQVLAGLALLVAKRPRAAARELRDLAALEPIGLLRARWRTRGRRAVRRRDLAGLFAPGRAVARRIEDEVHEAFTPAGAGARRTVSVDEVQLRGSGALRHPGLLAVAVATVTALLAGRSLQGGLLARLGGGVTGGEIVGARGHASTLWHAWLDGWHGSGLGGTDPVSPSAAWLAGLTAVLEQVPGVSRAASPVGAGVAAVLALAIPLGCLSAYVAARVVTPVRWARAVVAVLWACSGLAGAVVGQGRLGAAVALVLLPAVAAGLTLVARPGGTPTAAFATALGAGVLGAFAPPLLVLVVLVALGIAVAGPRGSGPRALVVALVPVGLLGPWLLAALDDWRLLLTGPGLAQWGGQAPPAWQLALLHPGGAAPVMAWAGVPVVALGVLALTRGRRAASGTSLLAALALVLLALTLLAPAVRLGVVPTGAPGAGEAVTPWPGTFMLPLALVLLAAGAAGLGTLPVAATPRGARSASRTLAATVALAALGGAGMLAWTTFGTQLRAWSDPRPAIAVDQAGGDLAGRTLFVTLGESGAGYRVVGRESAVVARDLPTLPAADAALAPTVRGLLAGDADAAPALAAAGVGIVALDASAPEETGRLLDASAGLTRLAPHTSWRLWRVSALGTGDERAVSPPRLRLESASGSEVVATTGDNAATTTTVTAAPGARLVVAQPPAWAGLAAVTVDGRQVAPIAGEAHPTYAVPAGQHDIGISLTHPHRWWQVLTLLLLALVVFLAVPFGSRESRRGR